MEFVQFEAESRAVSIGKPCRSLRKHHAAVSGIDVPLERNLQCITLLMVSTTNDKYLKTNSIAKFIDIAKNSKTFLYRFKIPIIIGKL